MGLLPHIHPSTDLPSNISTQPSFFSCSVSSLSAARTDALKQATRPTTVHATDRFMNDSANPPMLRRSGAPAVVGRSQKRIRQPRRVLQHPLPCRPPRPRLARDLFRPVKVPLLDPTRVRHHVRGMR